MKTTKQAAEQSGISERLIRSVIRQLGDRESLRDVLRGGADAGFSGFTYYDDTVAFFKQNRREIIELVKRMADDLGENAVNLVMGFRCLKDVTTEEEVGRVLYGARVTENDTQVANALAWFALEEVARAVADE